MVRLQDWSKNRDLLVSRLITGTRTDPTYLGLVKHQVVRDNLVTWLVKHQILQLYRTDPYPCTHHLAPMGRRATPSPRYAGHKNDDSLSRHWATSSAVSRDKSRAKASNPVDRRLFGPTEPPRLVGRETEDV